jgi:cyclomaltodextrinase / maltogenic alpha-amylase / neopullulanase
LAHWAWESFFYHIYPLGLCGAPRHNDFSSPPEPRLERLHGWLGHIRGLGANALYLGPLFESSGHGYDTADYYHVDRRLGTDQTLRDLVAACHEAGIRVVLDGVFNHVGRDFWAFKDVLANGRNSAYCDWFAGLRFDGRSPYGDPFVYEGWQGHFHLVKLNVGNPAVREHLFGAVASWIEDFDIDGIRLDAADVLDLGFQRALAEFCRPRKPDFWLLGEIVHGDYRRWVNPQTLDSVTNYECYKGIYSSLNDRNYFEIAYALKRQFGPDGIYRDLPLYDFVDNHDLDRLASVLRRRDHLNPAHCLLFTMPGVPSIYYGSEWAIEGQRRPGDDGPVRPALDLASAPRLGLEPGLADTIRLLAKIRAGSEALRRGSYRQLLVGHEQLAFGRDTDGESAIVMLNASERTATVRVQTPLSGEWTDALNGGSVQTQGDALEAEVPPAWARILIKRTAKAG